MHFSCVVIHFLPLRDHSVLCLVLSFPLSLDQVGLASLEADSKLTVMVDSFALDREVGVAWGLLYQVWSYHLT